VNFLALFLAPLRIARALVASLALLAGIASVVAQPTQQWVTNYYRVTGATLPEIRQSIRDARPWKNREEMDGFTDWRVTWQFTVMPTSDGCRCTTFNSQTRIVMTLPLWTPPTNVLVTVTQIWTNYFAALLRHEVGHGQMALAAAAEIHRRVKEQGGGSDCDSLKQSLNQIGQTVVAEYRQRDKDYDVRTQHGATQGARLPGRMRRERP
jgi:predicted secreted Zn-dependent protease